VVVVGGGFGELAAGRCLGVVGGALVGVALAGSLGFVFSLVVAAGVELPDGGIKLEGDDRCLGGESRDDAESEAKFEPNSLDPSEERITERNVSQEKAKYPKV
jgi:hypothetical protein